MGGSSVMYARLSCIWWLYLCCSVTTILANSSVVNEPRPPTPNGPSFTFDVDGSVAIAKTDNSYICATLDWWPPEKCDYGKCSWGQASLFNLDLKKENLIQAIGAFEPLKIRVGGLLQDKLIYQTDENEPCDPFSANPSEMFGFTQGCLTLHRWDQLNALLLMASAEVIFGLNALYGKSISEGVATGAWNSSNAEAFIRYSLQNEYPVSGWELGNDLSGSGVEVRVPADEYASDAILLRNKVDEIYKDAEFKPDVLAPGGVFDADWFTTFLQKSNNAVSGVTHHVYNLGAGDDEHLVDKIIDPSFLDGAADTYKSLQGIMKNTGNSGAAWVGAAGGVFGSGRDGISNAFVNSLWYVHQLGMAAIYDTKVYCRQSLIGGNYGLLDTNTFVPNPDFYVALLWHRLMGPNVLRVTIKGNDKIRAFAHCAKPDHGHVLVMMNFDDGSSILVATDGVNGNNSHLSVKLKKVFDGDDQNQNRNQMNMPGQKQNNAGVFREEYHLSPKDGDLHSHIMTLNGEELSVDGHGIIPRLKPKYVSPFASIFVEPYSIVFTHVPQGQFPACA